MVFYDTENAKLQNAITYPLASCVAVPRCYRSWVPRRRHIRYGGYHELSYRHPDYFRPYRLVAVANGLATAGDTFLIRVVSWRASHDLSERGWSLDLLTRLVNKLQPLGKVIISAEGDLPHHLRPLGYQGRASELHHVMAYCRAYIGESATMASESAVLGVPAVYAAETGRGYTDEQESRYGLVHNVRTLEWSTLESSVDAVLRHPTDFWRKSRSTLLGDTVDVARFAANLIESYPAPLLEYHEAAKA